MKEKLEEVVAFLSIDVPQLVNDRLHPDFLNAGRSLADSLERGNNYLLSAPPERQGTEAEEIILESQRARNLIHKIKEGGFACTEAQAHWEQRLEYIDGLLLELILFFDGLLTQQKQHRKI